MAPTRIVRIQGIAKVIHQLCRIELAPPSRCGLRVDVKIGVLVDLPASGHPAAKLQVLISVDEAFEDQGVDLAAGAVGG